MANLFKRILLFKIHPAKIHYYKLNPLTWRRRFFRKLLRFFIILIIFIAALIIVKDEVEYQFGWGFYSNDLAYYDEEEEDECNVLGIEVRGDIVTYASLDAEGVDYKQTSSEYVVAVIEDAMDGGAFRALILDIDSYGGSPVAAEEIEQAIKRVNQPVVALVRDAGASAAYWIASGADIIFASAMSDIGGIGATYSYLDNHQKNIKEGLTYNSLSTGKYKDYGDPDKPLTNDERRLIMRDLNIIHDKFIETVAVNRNLDIEKVRLLADGSSLPGQLALEAGLIDKIGSMYDVREYLKTQIGPDVSICW